MSSPKKTCEGFGIASVEELSQATGKPARTIAHWFNSEPALFKAVLTGVAVQKVTAESRYDLNEALELLKLGISVKQDSEAIARDRAEQLI
mgnify:CR=1 FL=1